MKSDCISCRNSLDYSKIHFWLLLLMVTFGSGLLWMIFRQSWLVLLVLIALLSLLSKQFKLELCIIDDKIIIKKTFWGFSYFKILYQFDKSFHSELNSTISFAGPGSSMVLIFSDHIYCIYKARKIILGNKKEADFVYGHLKKII